jgi:DNA-binding MurR/RpiR family transcriptional regulator
MNKKLVEKIANAKLTNTERRIAEYLVENDANVCFMTVAQIAKILNTSDTSIIRFCRSIGYSGFTEFQNDLQSKLFSDIGQEQNGVLSMSERYKRSTAQKKTMQSINNGYYLAFFEQVQKNILGIYSLNDDMTFHKAAAAICSAKRKYVVGFRGCASVVISFSRLLRHVTENVLEIIHEDRTVFECMLDVGPKDVVIVFSVPHHGNVMENAIKMAQDNGAKVCVITEKILSPVTKNANFVMLTQIQGSSFYNSQIGTQLIAEYLLSLIADLKGQSLDDRVKLINQYMPPDCN